MGGKKCIGHHDPNVILNFQPVHTSSDPSDDLLDGSDLASFTLGTQLELKKISHALKAKDKSLQGKEIKGKVRQRIRRKGQSTIWTKVLQLILSPSCTS